MRSVQYPFGSIERAIADLGSPDAIWLRGHAGEHRLIPALYRFPDGAAHERQIVDWYRRHMFSAGGKTSGDGLTLLIAMHHSYMPTRLLEWTERLHIALFCALVRESSNPTVFVLDPVALNARSNIAGIVTLDASTRSDCSLPLWPNESSLPEHPIAFNGRSSVCEGVGTEALFTLHGTNKFSLEEQCGKCVRKVLLTEEEKLLAEEGILSGKWLL